MKGESGGLQIAKQDEKAIPQLCTIFLERDYLQYYTTLYPRILWNNYQSKHQSFRHGVEKHIGESMSMPGHNSWNNKHDIND